MGVSFGATLPQDTQEGAKEEHHPDDERESHCDGRAGHARSLQALRHDRWHGRWWGERQR